MAPCAVPIETSHNTSNLSGGKDAGCDHDHGEIRLESHEKTDLVLRSFRCLIADLCEQFKGGHPG